MGLSFSMASAMRPACSFSNAAELDRAFGDHVRVLLHVFGDVIEEFVQADEVRAFHVPMRLLELALEIHRVGEALINQRV